MVKMILMITFWFFYIYHGLEAQIIKYGSKDQIIDIQSKTFLENKRLKLKISLQNKGKEDVYIFLSYWEINGLIEKTDLFLGYPHDSYTVNRIFFIPKDKDIYEEIETRGDKGDYPDFNKFPNVLKLTPNDGQCLIIEFNKSISKSLGINKYRFSCEISFAYKEEWDVLEKKIGGKIREAIIQIRKDPIVIKIDKFRKPEMLMISDVQINPKFSGMIRKTFDNFISGRCNLETDWVDD